MEKPMLNNTLFAIPATDELLTSNHLTSFNLAINTRIQGFVCLNCRVAVERSSLPSHFQNAHSGVTFNKPSQALAEHAATCATLPSNYTDITPSQEPVLAVDGIGVRDASGCPHCAYTANYKAVVRHIKSEHCEMGGLPIDGLKAQVLNSGKLNTLFRVTEKDVAAPEAVPPIVSQFLNSLTAAASPSSVPSNARMVSPWLHRTKFHLLLVGRDPEHLCHIVRSVGADEFLKELPEAITAYFETASNYIDASDELVLQWLNTADPDKEGISNHPLSRHYEHQSTLVSYTRPIVRLLASLLREPSSAYEMPTSSQLQAAIVELRKDLSNQTGLHALFLALWKTSWPVSEPNVIADPTIAFLALFTLQPSGNFSLPVHVTPIVARLTRALQLVMLTELHQMVARKEHATLLDAYSALAPYIQEKYPSTFNSLRSLQHYASTLAYNTLSMPRIVWEDTENYTSLLYEGRRLTLSHIHQFFVSLEDQAIKLWEHDILLGETVDLEYGVIADHLRCADPGYSFLTDPQNPFHKRVSDLGRILIPKHFTTHISATGAVVLNHIKVNRWLSSLEQLEGILMVSAEVKGGAPARGTEITSMTITNTRFRYRNGMALSRHVALIRQYDKTTSIRGSDRLIPHSLDAVTSNLLVLVHTFARPLAQYFARLVFPHGDAVAELYNVMMFMAYGAEFTSTDLSQLMGDLTLPITDWEIHINAWRHCHTTYKQKHCQRTFDALTEQHATSTIHALQTGHSLTTENRIYGLTPESMFGHSWEIIQLFLEASTEWQVVNHIVPGGLGVGYQEARASKFSYLASTLPRFPKFDKKGGGGIEEVAKPLQGLLESQMERLDAIRAILDRIEKRVDALEGSAKPLSPPSPTFTATLPFDIPSPSADDDSALTLPPFMSAPTSSTPPLTSNTVSMLSTLRKLYGENATWSCPEQKQAVEALVQCRCDVILALRTGIGKTAIAILPSMVEDSYTIVVCPLVLLIEDWDRRLNEHLIPHEVYKSAITYLKGDANLILATSDAIRSHNWEKAIRELSQRRPISRFIFDECQYWFTDADFRRKVMANPFVIRSIPTQFVLMSGTLPPLAEPFLIHHFGLKNVDILRHHSSRLEIKYERLQPVRDFADMLFDTNNLLPKIMPTLNPEDRFLIFVPSIADGKRIAAKLGTEMYHAHSEDHPITDEERRAIYTRWCNGEVSKGLVCSSALAAGNDYPHVRCTIHVNNPHNLVTFAQQSGRAGRDGRPATSVLLPHVNVRSAKSDEGDDLAGCRPMRLYTSKDTTECLRFLMSGFLDRQPHRCAELEGAVACGNCEGVNPPRIPLPSATVSPPQPVTGDTQSKPFQTAPSIKRSLEAAFGPAAEESRSRHRDLRIQQIQRAKDLLEFLQMMGQSCAYCFVSGVQPVGEHYGDRCPTLRSSRLQDCFAKEFRAQLRYESGCDPANSVRVCYTCHVTSGDDRTKHPPLERGQPKNCPYPNVVPQIGFMVYLNDASKEAAQQEFNARWESIGDFARWFTRKHEDQVYQSNGNALVAWFIKHME